VSKLGMNTETANDVANSIAGMAAGLAFIEQEVRLARAMSMNPINYLLQPGAGVLAPASIGIAASASADIANVRQTLDYLVLKLRQEATQQFQVSNSLLVTDPGWFAQAPTAVRPDEIGIFEQELDALGIVAFWGGLVLLGRDVVDAVDSWVKNLPPDVKTGLKVVLRGGKFIPFVGVGFSAISLVAEWDNENVWGNWRNGIGLGIDVASAVATVLLVPPLTPVGAVVEAGLLGLGIAWDVMDLAWDTHDEGMWQWPWE
jgi:hypothetical protein